MNLKKYVQWQSFPQIQFLKRGKHFNRTSSFYKLDPTLMDNIRRIGKRLANADLMLIFDLKHSTVFYCPNSIILYL